MAVDGLVFLLDVDNTLLDNDRVHDDLSEHFDRELGAGSGDRYWAIFEALRTESGYADYLGALQRYRCVESSGGMNDPRLLLMSSFLVDYPFADRLYPGALAAIAHLRTLGTTVILSDGDVVFQPRKIQRSGLWKAVDGRVLIYIHKEQMLDDLERRYPARHYVMVDDKLSILTAMKEIMGHRLTTVFPHQGHYAFDPHNISAYPPADLAIERIGDLLFEPLRDLMTCATPGAVIPAKAGIRRRVTATGSSLSRG
jgi:FMN phosphatase YigB (HAD superfamily)